MRLLITGMAGGLLGGVSAAARTANRDGVVAWVGPRGGEQLGVSLRPLDLTDAAAVAAAFRSERPDVVLHAAALARVADCWRDPERARRVNTDAARTLAGLAADAGARVVLVSTDLVFDGEKGTPYRRDPRGVPPPPPYLAWTKREAEVAALAVPRSAAVRVSLLYGPSLHGRPSFFDEQAAALRAGRPVTLFRDEWRTPFDLVTAARALLAVAESDFTGLLHVGGPEQAELPGWRWACAWRSLSALPPRRSWRRTGPQHQHPNPGRARRISRFRRGTADGLSERPLARRGRGVSASCQPFSAVVNRM